MAQSTPLPLARASSRDSSSSRSKKSSRMPPPQASTSTAVAPFSTAATKGKRARPSGGESELEKERPRRVKSSRGQKREGAVAVPAAGDDKGKGKEAGEGGIVYRRAMYARFVQDAFQTRLQVSFELLSSLCFPRRSRGEAVTDQFRRHRRATTTRTTKSSRNSAPFSPPLPPPPFLLHPQPPPPILVRPLSASSDPGSTPSPPSSRNWTKAMRRSSRRFSPCLGRPRRRALFRSTRASSVRWLVRGRSG